MRTQRIHKLILELEAKPGEILKATVVSDSGALGSLFTSCRYANAALIQPGPSSVVYSVTPALKAMKSRHISAYNRRKQETTYFSLFNKKKLSL